MKALVIDDAPDTRLYVRALLKKWGHETETASDGVTGLASVRSADVRLVVCDWMMPGMSGPEVCRAIRAADLDRYVYVILLTGRSDKADLVEGLNAGADDFLSKPFDAQVLRARLRVAERILALEQRLAEQNRELRDSRNRLEQAYDQIQADLAAAARVQRQMLPTSDRAAHPLRAHWLFLPAAQVSGDSFNFFELGDDLLGFYHLDVSGHGIPAALLSASLSRSLVPGGGPGVAVRSDFLCPAEFLADLNRQLGSPDGEVENFATIAYGTLDKRSGEGRIALAGHPHPLIVRQSGETEYLTESGLPVGMFPEVTYRAQSLRLDPGDRLVLHSDGVTDCQSPHGEAFGEARLRESMVACICSAGPEPLAALGTQLRQWHGPADFADDVSVLVLERPAPSPLPAARDPEPQGGNRNAMTTPHTELTLDSDPSAVADLQTRLSELARLAGLDELGGFQFTCAIVEAVNNCIKHAYDGEAGHLISLAWVRHPDAVAVEIRDRGRPLPARVIETRQEASTEAESGRGWPIIRAWTDSVTYVREADVNVLTLTRRLH